MINPIGMNYNVFKPNRYSKNDQEAQKDFFEISMLLKKKGQIDKKGARKQSNPCLHTTTDPFTTLQVKFVCLFIDLLTLHVEPRTPGS